MNENARGPDCQKEIGEKPPRCPQPAMIGLRAENPRRDIGKNGQRAGGIKHPAESSEIGNRTIKGYHCTGQRLRAFREARIKRDKGRNQHKARRKNPSAGNEKTPHQYPLIVFLAYGFAIRKNNRLALSLLWLVFAGRG